MSANVIPLIPDSPFSSKSPLNDPGISEPLGFAELSRVKKLVERIRKQIVESIEQQLLLESDPDVCAIYRSCFRIVPDGATEFEIRNAVKIANGTLSPSARVEVLFEKKRLPEGGAECSVAIYPRELAA